MEKTDRALRYFRNGYSCSQAVLMALSNESATAAKCDADAFREGDAIIHLAASNIGEGRWTTSRKREIMQSRTLTGQLLHRMTAATDIRPSVFVTASGVNYYGTGNPEHAYTENDPPAEDFLGETCRLWEAAADQFDESGTRSVPGPCPVINQIPPICISATLKVGAANDLFMSMSLPIMSMPLRIASPLPAIVSPSTG